MCYFCFVFHEKMRNQQTTKNRSENGLKRTVWRGCIQLKNDFLSIEMCLNQYKMSSLRL